MSVSRLADVAALPIRTNAGLVSDLGRVLEIGQVDLVRDHLGLGVDIGRADRRRPAHRGLDHLGQRLVGEDLVGARDRGRLAGEIERQPQALVLVAGLLLHRLRDVLGGRAGRGCGGRGRVGAEGGEIEGRGELAVTGVGELVGEGVLVRDPLGQHLAHERLGVGHVAEAIGLHRIGVEAIVLQEVVDRLHVADMAEEVIGLAADIRLLRDLRHRLAQVLGQSGVVRDGG